jgi:hypothetical protein
MPWWVVVGGGGSGGSGGIRQWSSQCGRDVEGREEKEAISNLSFIIELRDKIRKKKGRLAMT